MSEEEKTTEEMILEVSKEFFLLLMGKMAPEEFVILSDWAFQERCKSGEPESVCILNALQEISQREEKNVGEIVDDLAIHGAKKIVPIDFVCSWDRNNRG